MGDVDGWVQNMLAMLQQQYPSQLMQELYAASQGALDDMLAAFPNQPSAPATHLHHFVSGETRRTCANTDVMAMIVPAKLQGLAFRVKCIHDFRA